MTLKKIIRIIMISKELSNQTLAEKCGYATASGVSNVINRDNGMRVESLLKMLEVMDCELVVRSKTDRTQEWTIDV